MNNVNNRFARNLAVGTQNVLFTLDGVTEVHAHWGEIVLDSDNWSVATLDAEGHEVILGTGLSREAAIRQHRAAGLEDCWLYS
jgi:hypothetical protein